MKIINALADKVYKELYYLKHKSLINSNYFDVDIMSIDDTIKFMSQRGHSIIRFGDGELMIMNGKGIDKYQKYDVILGEKLKNIFERPSDTNLLLCLPEPMTGVSKYIRRSRVHWTYQLFNNETLYRNVIKTDRIYGNSFVSRPYIIYKDKRCCAKWFSEIKRLFTDKNIVIIEGKYSRTGIGNDLLDNALSIRRILCPSQNAFSNYDSILEEAKKIEKEALILIAIGPTGKVLTADLFDLGYWALDIGHIDSEYEWFINQSRDKTMLSNKHTADRMDGIIGECNDPNYKKSIIADLSTPIG